MKFDDPLWVGGVLLIIASLGTMLTGLVQQFKIKGKVEENTAVTIETKQQVAAAATKAIGVAAKAEAVAANVDAIVQTSAQAAQQTNGHLARMTAEITRLMASGEEDRKTIAVLTGLLKLRASDRPAEAPAIDRRKKKDV